MDNKVCMMIRVLLQRFARSEREAVLKNLPQPTIQSILNQEIHSDNVALLLAQPQELIGKVHYSWLHEAFMKIPQALAPFVLTALPKTHADGLSRLSGQAISPVRLAEPVTRFLVNTLYENFEKREILPLEYLPPSPQSNLLNLSKVELSQLFSFLGLYDLADAIRHIVDKKKLTTIYACLGAEQQRFLRNCLHQKEKLVISKLNLDQWDGDKSKLDIMLHKRGIMRFGKAISGEHPDFVWHIVHTLDSGRGKNLLSFYESKRIPGVTDALSLQLNSVINFLNKKTKST